MAIYFYYGEEEYNIEQEVDKLKKGLDKNFSGMNFKVYDHPDFVDLIAILRTQPMMFGKMLIVIKCFNYFSQTFDDKQIKEITEALDDNNDNTDIVFVAEAPRDGEKKIDARRKLFKVLSKYNAKAFSTIAAYKLDELSLWVKKYAKELSFENDALITFVSQIGNNLRQLAEEADKLKLFIYPEKKVTKKHVTDLCISNQDILVFADHILKSERDEALMGYRILLRDKPCMKIVATLQTMLHKWILLKSKSGELPVSELAKIVNQNEYFVKLTLQKLKTTNLKDLVKLKQNITEFEYNVKTGKSLKPESDFEMVLFR